MWIACDCRVANGTPTHVYADNRGVSKVNDAAGSAHTMVTMAPSPSKNLLLAPIGVLVLSIGAIAVGIYLTIEHIHIKLQISGTGLCYALASGGCEVTGGRFGSLLGVPVSVIGLAGAITTASLATIALFRRFQARDVARGLLFLVACASVIASVVMFVLSFVEGSFCPFCVVWYGINVATWVLAFWGLDQPVAAAVVDAAQKVYQGTGLIAVGTFVVAVFGGNIVYHQTVVETQAERAENDQNELRNILAGQPSGPTQVPDSPIRQSRAVGSNSGQNAHVKPVSIVKLSDFECPYCKRFWLDMEAFLNETHLPVTLSFVHFPLDAQCNPLIKSEFHIQACQAAVAAECARQQGKFWEYADRLFENQPRFDLDPLLAIAGEVGLDKNAFEFCINDPSASAKVRADVEIGLKQQVTGTPTLFVDGFIVRHALRKDQLEQLVRDILANRKTDGANN